MVPSHPANGVDAPPATAATPPPAPQHQYMSYDALAASLTRFEMGIVRLHEAFSGWARELQKYVSGQQMTFPEVALLVCVRLRGGSTTMAEMMMFLHRHDLAAISYSLRKLEQNGLIRRMRGPNRREVAYAVTDRGREVTDAYGRMRHQVLVQLCREVVGMQASANEAAGVMERMIGIYDQAAQTILNQAMISSAARIPPEPVAEARPRAAEAEPAAAANAGAPLSAARAKRTPPRARAR